MDGAIKMELTIQQARALADLTAQVIWSNDPVHEFYNELTDRLDALGLDEPAYELKLDEDQGTITLVRI